MYKKIATCLYFTLLLGLLTACAPSELLRLKTSESPHKITSKESDKTSKNTNISTPVALPPYFGDKPVYKSQPQSTKLMPNGMPALHPMKGINADTMFSKDIKNNSDRFNRVEDAVVDLRKEFDTYKPAIVRLTAVESDIQNLIKELDVLLQETPADQQPTNLINDAPPQEVANLQVEQLNTEPTKPPPDQQPVPQLKNVKNKTISPPQEAKKVEKVKPDLEKPPPSKKSLPKYDGVIAKNLRAGEHADHLRIVIDTNKVTDFNIDLDNDEKLIIIELPNARWIGNKEHSFNNLKLLESYAIETINNGKGSMIVLSLKNPTNIIREKRLSPDNDNPYQRIYFDLKM